MSEEPLGPSPVSDSQTTEGSPVLSLFSLPKEKGIGVTTVFWGKVTRGSKGSPSFSSGWEYGDPYVGMFYPY